MATEQEIRANAKRLEAAGAPLSDIEKYVSMASKEMNQIQEPQTVAGKISGYLPTTENPQTLAGKTLQGVRNFLPPLTPSEFGNAAIDLPMSMEKGKAYNALENAGSQVQKPIDEFAGNIAEKIGRTGDVMGGATAGTVVGMLSGGLRPSAIKQGIGMAGMTSVLPMTLPTSINPEINMASPKIAEKGLADATIKLGSKDITPTKTGQRISNIYDKNVADLKDAESKAFKPLEDNKSLENAPANLGTTKIYVENLFKQNQGTNEQGIPIDLIRQKYPNYSPAPTSETVGMMKENQPQLPSGEVGIFTKIQRALAQPELSASDVKSLRTMVGYEIKKNGGWNATRTNEPVFRLKQLYGTLSQDYLNAAKDAGIEGEVTNASKATSNLYDYLGQPSAKIIDKNIYNDELPAKLIKSDSPERIQELYDKHHFTEADKNIVRQNLVNQVVKNAVEKAKDKQLYVDDIAKGFESMSPDFIDAAFGEDAKLVKGIKDASMQTKTAMEDARIGRGLPSRTAFALQWAKGLFTRYKITPDVYDMLVRTQGKEIADQLVPYKPKEPINMNFPKIEAYQKNPNRPLPIPVDIKRKQ